MHYRKFFLPLVLVALQASIFGEVQKQDVDQVKQYLETRRSVGLEDKYGDGSLTIGGEIGVEHRHYNKKYAGQKATGVGKSSPTDKYNIIPKLNIKYKAERTWAALSLKFKNDMGWDKERLYNYNDPNAPTPQKKRSGSGSYGNISLEKAMFGFNAVEDDQFRFDVELGRQPSEDLFDSKIQFDSSFDGIAFKLSNNFPGVGKAHLHFGPTLTESFVNHYGLIAEVGLAEIADTGLYAKYSFTQWKKKRKDVPLDATGKISNASADIAAREKNARRWRYQNSQITLGYKFDPEMLGFASKVYGAYLCNHAAKKNDITNKKENKAWYVGFTLGDALKKEGDWQFDVNYQHVAAQCIPDYDMGGIGSSFGYVPRDHLNSAISEQQAYTSNNYKGAAAKAKYAITDNMHLEVKYQFAKAIRKSIRNAKLQELMVGGYYRF